MVHKNPNFESYLKSQFNLDQHSVNTPRPGVVQSYDPLSNTATVVLSGVDSDVTHQVLTDVICPVTMGVVTVAPEPGRPCWVAFKGGRNDNKAIILSYFNHNYQTYDMAKQTDSNAGVPRFMLGM